MTDDLHDRLDQLVDRLPALSPLPARVAIRGNRRRRAKLAGAGLGGILAVGAIAVVALPRDSQEDRLVPQIGVVASAAPTSSAPPSLPAVTPVVVLERGGLGYLTGSSSIRHLLFGQSAPADVEALLDRALGPGTSSPLPDCGPQVVEVQYPGFTLVLDRSRFVGWSDRGSPGRSLLTADGLGVGSTLAQLRDAIPDIAVVDGSLGSEWNANGISGFLGGVAPTSRVTVISSGQNCLLR